MSHYDDIRNRIHRQMVPLPILYRDDYSIDHAGLAKYIDWHLENDTQNFCLTFTYSQLDFVTADEIVEVTRTVMEVVRDDAVFISCTGGGPLHEAIRTVQAFEKIWGTCSVRAPMPEHCLQNPSHCGELYVEYIRGVAKETEIPLLAVALPVPWSAPSQTMLPVQRFEELCEDATIHRYQGRYLYTGQSDGVGPQVLWTDGYHRGWHVHPLHLFSPLSQPG